MKPGIHYDIPFDEYLAIDAVNCSLLKQVAKSLAHARWYLDHPSEPTTAMKFGKLLHLMTLEPEKFNETYMIAKKIDKRTTAGKAAWAAFLEEAQGKELVSFDDFKEAKAIKESVHANRQAIQFVQNGKAEVTIVWEDDKTGLLCKARIDYLHWDHGVLVDLKSTKDASPDGFSREMMNYGYHIQSAWYKDGIDKLTDREFSFVLVAAEKSAPYVVSCYETNDYSLEAGRIVYRKALDAYAAAKESGWWPGYIGELRAIDIPDYALNNIGVKRE